MTISTTIDLAGPFTPNGITTSFPFAFQVVAADEILVQTVDGEAAPISINPGAYTVILNENGTGRVVFTIPPRAGPKLYIYGNPRFTQELDFKSQERFSGLRHEQGFDRSAVRDIYLKRRVDAITAVLAEEGIFLGGVVDGSLNREVWLDRYYASESATDNDALLAFASDFNAGAIGPCTLRFPTLGRGPSGRFLIDTLVEFTGGTRLIIDFGTATTRFTTPDSCLRYSPGQIFGSSAVTPVPFFVVRGGVHQYTAGCQYMFDWNFKFHPSRSAYTGYAENMRIHPQSATDLTHTLVAPFLTRNTWGHCVRNCEVIGPPRSFPSIVANTCIVEQRGFCVIGDFDNVAGTYHDRVIIPGTAQMVGVTGTFTSGTFTRGKALRQGANIAYFARSDGAYGWAYSLYDETGTLTTGAAELLDSGGVVVGSFNIATIGRYEQCSEAIRVDGGSSFIQTNYFAKVAAANQLVSRFLNWSIQNTHMAMHKGHIEAVGLSDLQVGAGVTAFLNNAGGYKCFKIDYGDSINIESGFYTTNALGGKFAELTNIIGGHIKGNTLFFFDTASTTDNTVKDFGVEDNSTYQCTAWANTGKRYNYVNTRGIRFSNNGAWGVGVDTDEPRKVPWTPTVTGSVANPTTITNANGGYVLGNGRLTLSCKFTITSTGTPSGDMRITLPTLPAGVLFDSAFTAYIGNLCVPAFVDAINNRLFIQDAGGGTNGTASGWKQANNLVPNGTAVFISGTAAVEYD